MTDRSVREYLLLLADGLDKAKRSGSGTDRPEGSRVVTISDTAVRDISNKLRECVKVLQKELTGAAKEVK